jgi:SAF domain
VTTAGVDSPARSRFGSAAVGAAPPPAVLTDEGEAGSRRRPVRALLAFALLLALGVAVLAGRAWDGFGMGQAWQITRDLAAGETLGPGDVRAVRLTRTSGADVLDDARPPVGAVLSEPVRAGSVLLRAQVGSGPAAPGPGEVLVGVAATASRVPGGLAPGDSVRLLALPPAAAPGQPQGPVRVLVRSARVQRVQSSAQGAAVTLVVPASAATQAGLLAAQDRLVLLGLPR